MRGAMFLPFVLTATLGWAGCTVEPTWSDARPAGVDEASPDVDGDGHTSVFFFGHSLMGHDMPQMVASFGRARGHSVTVQGQIGWGTPIGSHVAWQGGLDSAPAGVPEEMRLLDGDQPARLWEAPGMEVLARGQTDVIVVTDVHEREEGSPGNWREFCTPDDMLWACAVQNLAELTRSARRANPNVRVLLYTSWAYCVDDGPATAWNGPCRDQWLQSTRTNLGWWTWVAEQATREAGAEVLPIEVIPAGQVLADVVERSANGDFADSGVTAPPSLFSDAVHLQDVGFYPVALSVFSEVFGESPTGLPASVSVVGEDNAELVTLDVQPALAAAFQQTVVNYYASE